MLGKSAGVVPGAAVSQKKREKMKCIQKMCSYARDFSVSNNFSPANLVGIFLPGFMCCLAECMRKIWASQMFLRLL